MDDKQLPAPVTPAEPSGPTKLVAEKIVRLGDYLGRRAGYSATMRRRKVLTRSGKVIDGDTLRRLPEPPRRDPVQQLYARQETGLVISPMPTTPLKPDYADMVIRFTISRLKEPSTWRGILLVLTSIGIAIDPEKIEAITAVGIALTGLVGVLFPDAGKVE